MWITVNKSIVSEMGGSIGDIRKTDITQDRCEWRSGAVESPSSITGPVRRLPSTCGGMEGGLRGRQGSIQIFFGGGG